AAKLISLAENRAGERDNNQYSKIFAEIQEINKKVPVLGITGTGGAGKSSLTDELIRRFIHEIPEKKVAILSVDPTKQKTGGALLGDRIRMNAIFSPRVYMRSLATRGSRNELSEAIHDAIQIVKAMGVDLVIVETSGIGQGDAEIREVSDVSMYVMTSEFGAPTQLE
ncbi:methylmalonyl-CoA mutase, partial [Butyricicoccus sp. 1XD8-22]